MKNLIKALACSWLCVVVVLTPVAGCHTDQLPPEYQEQIEEAEGEAQTLAAQAVAAIEAGDAEAYGLAMAALDEVEIRMAEIVSDGAKAKGDSLFAALSGIPIVGPIADALGVVGTTALFPLLFNRPRKNVLKAVRAANPFNGPTKPMDAIQSLVAAYGIVHSSVASKQAFDAEEAAPRDTVADFKL